MANVINKNGTEVDFNASINMMDDEIREELHSLGYGSEQDFFNAYETAHNEKFKKEWELSKANPVW